MTTERRWRQIARGITGLGSLVYLFFYILGEAGLVGPSLQNFLCGAGGLAMAAGLLLYALLRKSGRIQPTGSWWGTVGANALWGAALFITGLDRLIRPNLSLSLRRPIGFAGGAIFLAIVVAGIVHWSRWNTARRKTGTPAE